MNYDEKQNRWAEMAGLVDDVRREVERERERLVERVERMDVLLKIVEHADELLEEIETLKETLRDRDEEIEELRSQLQEEKEQRAKLEMQLSEMSKLSAGVAKKASQDELIKALRVFVNISKRKSIDKRAHVRSMIMELSDAANLTMPEDLRETLSHLDDEEGAPLIHIDQTGDVIGKGGRKIVRNYLKEDDHD